MKAILARNGHACFLEVPVPVIGDGEFLLAVEACGLCGTDVMKLDTRAQGAILGHELCGTVSIEGSGSPFHIGERVVVSHHVPCLACHYCRKGQESMCRQFRSTNIDPGGFSEFVRVPALHARYAAFKAPEGLDPIAASQTEPLACILRNVKRLSIGPGDVIGIIGLGAIGQMTGQLLKLIGAASVGLDLDAERVKRFNRWGKATADAIEFAQLGKDQSSGRGFDAIIFSAGTPALVARCVSWLRDGGILNIFASFHPDPFLKLDLNQVYHREISVLSSYSPSLADLKEAFELIASKRFNPLLLAPLSFPLSAFADAVKAVKTRQTLKSILVPR